MIQADQPTDFADGVLVRVSSRDDGTMLDRSIDPHDPSVVANRRQFCEQAGLEYDSCAYQVIQYGPEMSYDTIYDVKTPDLLGIEADMLYTDIPGVILFLPLADCVGTVIFDSKRRAVAMVHLGRHSSIAKLMTKAIDNFTSRGSQASDLKIWMAPSVAASDYIMEYFDQLDDPDWQPFAKQTPAGIQLDLQSYNASLAKSKGVKTENIIISPINTARDANYFSHSQGDTSGRFAVLAVIQ